nr:MAG TPA: Restriction endonuclease [Caudoviricetes sp.]
MTTALIILLHLLSCGFFILGYIVLKKEQHDGGYIFLIISIAVTTIATIVVWYANKVEEKEVELEKNNLKKAILELQEAINENLKYEHVLPKNDEYKKRCNIHLYELAKEKYSQEIINDDDDINELKRKIAIFKNFREQQNRIFKIAYTLMNENKKLAEKVADINVDFFIEENNIPILNFRNFELVDRSVLLTGLYYYDKRFWGINDKRLDFIIEKNDILNILLRQKLELNQQYLSPCKHKIRMAYLNPSKCPICQKDFDNFLIKNDPKRYQQKILDEYENERAFRKPEEIGARYERYIGYLYEINGYEVEYNGIKMGKKDDGIDIIATKRRELIIIQCKWYKEDSQIHSSTIRQLNDNLSERAADNSNKKVVARLYSAYDNLDEQARARLAKTQIEHVVLPYDNEYPKIKCNINDDNGEKIYHLPGVGMYDYIKINVNRGEFYVKTIEEAEKLGFRDVKKELKAIHGVAANSGGERAKRTERG